ncbi:MAG: two-component system cell cycle sensor histidine kinase/response regulator CckA [Polyangiales bacterium]
MLSNDEIIRGIGDGLPVGVWIARAPNGEFVYANQRFRDVMGMPGLEEAARGDFAEPYAIHNLSGDLYAEEKMPFVLALQSGETEMVDDIVIHRRDGKKVNIRAYARPVFDEGTISHIAIAFFDITREVEAENARKEAEARVRETHAMESLGTLAGGVAHDFNNLLGAISLLASALETDETNPLRLEHARSIQEVAKTASQLAESLLTFTGRGKNLAQPISLTDAVDAVETLLRHGLRKNTIVEVSCTAKQGILGDRSRLERVVMNLVLNARDSMHPNGGRIQVRTLDDGEFVVLEVEDEGSGVPEDLREHIFKPFFSTKGPGRHASAGLGLAMVYGVAESHGGTVEVTDGVKGALFRLRIPATHEEPIDRPRTDGETAINGVGTILVVDDEVTLREAAVHVLEGLGYTPLAAEGGEEALRILGENPDEIDAVILDMTMPGMDGKATYRAMRAIRADIPVLLTTGYALNEEAQAILDMGVGGFLEKPWNATRLSRALAELLSAD